MDIGRIIKSKKTSYKIDEYLGKGGEGKVFKVKDLSDNKYYALKETEKTDETKTRDFAEKAIVVFAEVKNVVKCFDVFEAEKIV